MWLGNSDCSSNWLPIYVGKMDTQALSSQLPRSQSPAQHLNRCWVPSANQTWLAGQFRI